MTRRTTSRALGRQLLGVVVSVALGGRAADAQDTASARLRDDSFVGSARVGVSALYAKPGYSLFSVSALALPFVTEHLQVGLAPAFEVAGTGNDEHFFAASVAAVVNYLPSFGDHGVSRPYFGAFAAQSGQSNTSGYGVIGAQAGWLRFFSPAVALRAETRLRHYFFHTSDASFADVLVTIDPYLFGRASRRPTMEPSLGVFDASVVAEFQLEPSRTLQLEGSLAPFLMSWLQVGASANLDFDFDVNSSTRALEGFSRAYLPLDVRYAPFADLFIGTQSQGFDAGTIGNRGARAGLRAYLTPGVALDVAMQWRAFASERVGANLVHRPEERTIRATLTTQFRARLGSR